MNLFWIREHFWSSQTFFEFMNYLQIHEHFLIHEQFLKFWTFENYWIFFIKIKSFKISNVEKSAKKEIAASLGSLARLFWQPASHRHQTKRALGFFYGTERSLVLDEIREWCVTGPAHILQRVQCCRQATHTPLLWLLFPGEAEIIVLTLLM